VWARWLHNLFRLRQATWPREKRHDYTPSCNSHPTKTGESGWHAQTRVVVGTNNQPDGLVTHLPCFP
jgi:hypothetical protein